MGHFAPYVKHTLAEEPDNLEKVLARDPDRRAACAENILARKRWVQFLDAAGSLTGKFVRIMVNAETHTWTDCHVARIERSMNVVSECFVVVNGVGLRIPVCPQTEILIEASHV